MPRWPPVLLLSALLVAAAAEPWATERYFPLTGVPGFIGLTAELQRRLDASGRGRTRFCVVGQELRSRGEARPSLSAITFWQEVGEV